MEIIFTKRTGKQERQYIDSDKDLTVNDLIEMLGGVNKDLKIGRWILGRDGDEDYFSGTITGAMVETLPVETEDNELVRISFMDG